MILFRPIIYHKHKINLANATKKPQREPERENE